MLKKEDLKDYRTGVIYYGNCPSGIHTDLYIDSSTNKIKKEKTHYRSMFWSSKIDLFIYNDGSSNNFLTFNTIKYDNFKPEIEINHDFNNSFLSNIENIEHSRFNDHLRPIKIPDNIKPIKFLNKDEYFKNLKENINFDNSKYITLRAYQQYINFTTGKNNIKPKKILE